MRSCLPFSGVWTRYVSLLSSDSLSSSFLTSIPVKRGVKSGTEPEFSLPESYCYSKVPQGDHSPAKTHGSRRQIPFHTNHVYLGLACLRCPKASYNPLTIHSVRRAPTL